MEPIPLPVIPVEDAENTALAILPSVSLDHLKTVSFEVEDDCLNITCRYAEGHDEDETLYPVKITDSNRDLIESMEKLAVMDSDQVEPDALTAHPKERDKLNRLLAEVRDSSETDLGQLSIDDRVNGN